jgi:hypothetical protein
MKKLLWVPLLTLFCSEGSMSDDPATKPIKKVLAFGGNGFIGSTVLQVERKYIRINLRI